MSQKERVKFVLELSKTAIFAFIAALFSIFAFLVINYKILDFFQVIMAGVGAIFLCVLSYFVARHLAKNLDKLEEL